MVFVPADRYLWDFWLAPRRPGSTDPYRLFYLQAPRDLPDPELRHGVATVGQAVSRDLVHWEERGTALEAGPAGSWDDRAIWTGSIVERDGMFHWFYTGIGRRDWVQRIGLATSDDPDLERWERHPSNPLLEADPRWYEKQVAGLWPAEACRDPWLVWAPDEAVYYMLYTAREREPDPSSPDAGTAASPERAVGPMDGRGVIGLARSTDLVEWEPLPPLVAPGEFGEMEVPQVVHLDDRWYLLFCTAKHAADRLARTGPTGRWFGTHYLVADDLLGPYRLLTDEPLVGDEAGSYYAGRIVDDPDGRPVFLAWRQWSIVGTFLGGLSDPSPVRVLADGRLEVESAMLWSQE